MNWTYITAFFLSLFISLYSVPYVMGIAEKKRVYDRPDKKRKIHSTLIPLWGGIGIYVSFYLTLLLLFLLFPSVREIFLSKNFREKTFGIFLASTLILLTGASDDRRPLQPTVKLLLQIIATFIVILYGIKVTGLNLPFFKYIHFPKLIMIIFTTLWLIGFTNVINLVDGLDGLAGGITVIASITFFLVNLIQAEHGVIQEQLIPSSIFSLLIAGSTLGFLYYNFYPANIFLGDSGSLFLGFMLGITTILGMLKLVASIALIIPIIVVALPIFDVILAIIRRAKKGKSIMEADSSHFHHILLKLGWNQREVVLLIYNITLILSIIAILIATL
ncbi:MAG: undecaprenyl/decaprenyl-phosphate alpha-N-acetylglucosaminyl 1-phosphate transferase [Caldiserica bacterium]|mgnify:CR=1 FL=1|nr:MAG: undecaprenyl/decaprenyl-phosphate alpha-N-acetylglucosaminyl 1-phosphate transferase [Caldisericota bacterium]